ncbi:MAG: RNA polymerase sigma factor [Acidobacteria bacterium]|nr:RNA polymerase sigma factor [Acidobacteriota bacterium]
MRHPAYPSPILPPSFISENCPFKERPFNPEQPEWRDEEIAAIRIVLQKLTALRIYNENDAEDVVQETLLTMISKQRGMTLEKSRLAWSLGILRNKVGNYYRKAQRYTPLTEQEANALQGLMIASPEAKIFQEELKTIVNGILSQFPPPQRHAMELMFDGFNAGEIAKQLHPERYQNVINSLYRGRKKIARALEKYGYIPNSLSGLQKMKKSRGRKSKPDTGSRQ